MKTAKNAIAVGLITVAMAAGLYFSLKFISESANAEGEYRLFAIFPDASGIVEKSRIRVAGITIGYIESIKLEEYKVKIQDSDGEEAREEVRVGARINLMIFDNVAIYENAKALRSADGLLGNQFVAIVPGDSRFKKLKDGDQIKNVSDAGMMGHLDEITEDVKQVTRNLRNVFGTDEGGRTMGEALANLRDISASMKQLLENNSTNVNHTLNNLNGIAADARPAVRQILEDIKKITSDVKAFIENASGKAGSVVDQADGTVRDIRTVIVKLDKSLENLVDVTEGLKQGEGTAGRLLKDDKLIDDVEDVVDNAGGFVKGITDLKTIVGLSGEYNIIGGTVKTGLQLRLQPREDKYYMIEAIYDPRGTTSSVTRTITTTDPDENSPVTEKVTTTRDELLFSLMFARRINFATFRFGIKESSGGLGVDLLFLRDRIELSTDIYRFGDERFPCLKNLIAIEFLKHMYIIGGVNDILNENRDFFAGLMIRFNDEDLKTILPFAPSPT